MSDFELNQIFEGSYPPEAADWCNDGGLYHIEEIEAVNGARRFQIVENPEETEEEKAARINNLSLTAADVERAIYKARAIDFDDIIETVETMNEAGSTDIDIKALKIELKANNFYRGNAYVEQIGTLLGFTSDDLDYLFETGSLPESEG